MLIVLHRQFLLPYILAVLRWIPLLEKGGEPHRVIAGLNSLNSTIQTPIAGEEISEGAFYWVKSGTPLMALALPLLGVSTKGTGKSPSPTILKHLLLARRQRRFDYFNILFRNSHWFKVRCKCPYWHINIIHNLFYLVNTYANQ